MQSLEIITSVRITKDKGLTPAQIIEIVKGINGGYYDPGEEGRSQVAEDPIRPDRPKQPGASAR